MDSEGNLIDKRYYECNSGLRRVPRIYVSKTPNYWQIKKISPLTKITIVFIAFVAVFIVLTIHKIEEYDFQYININNKLKSRLSEMILSRDQRISEYSPLVNNGNLASEENGGLMLPINMVEQMQEMETISEYSPLVNNGNLAAGENGEAVTLPANMSEQMQARVTEGWKKNAFNQYVSDLINVNRSLPDVREARCKEPGRYLTDLPATSVVICFHNEAWSTLLRTVHSVLNRSPESLIKEIILVDDYSNLLYTNIQLEEYLIDFPKVKLVRTNKREGLIRARLIGLRYVTATVVTYLDSHCECTDGWLEPLLDRIARNPMTVVCPTIDTINDTTFQYSQNLDYILVGGFKWNLVFRWHRIQDSERTRRINSAEPVRTPTMAGGLFAIDKAFFEKLGTFDEGMDIWGGENLELSFKVWMCGGTLEILPCSHVGHIFRTNSPYTWVKGVNVVLRNSARLAEVWLDEYTKYFYQEVQYDPKDIDIGDLSERRALRHNLGCKSFDWYKRNVYPELPIPAPLLASGEIRNLGSDGRQDMPYYCLDSGPGKLANKKPMRMRKCHEHGHHQFWRYTTDNEIRKVELCLDSYDGNIALYYCHKRGVNQYWKYDPSTNLIRHKNGKKCLATDWHQKLVLETCDETNIKHMWVMQNYDASLNY